MTYYVIIMIVFGLLVILSGFHIYKGHDTLLWRGYYKKRSKGYLKYVGKLTMLIGLVMIITNISGLFFEEMSFIPILLMIIGIVLSFIIYIKKYGSGEDL